MSILNELYASLNRYNKLSFCQKEAHVDGLLFDIPRNTSENIDMIPNAILLFLANLPSLQTTVQENNIDHSKRMYQSIKY